MAAISSSVSVSGCARIPSPPPSSRCFLKNHGGLSAQASGFICSERSDLSKAFHKKDKQFVRSRLHLDVACRAGMIMMPVGEPLVRYRNPEGGYQWVDLTNALLRDRVVCLSQFIDDDFSNAILGTLLYLDSVDPGKLLNMLVLGGGGDVQPSLQIYDTMESLSSPIATYGLGYIDNLSGYILAAGDKGKRNMMFSANIIFDPISGAARGNADDIINEANELARIRDYLFKQLELKTGQPFEKSFWDGDGDAFPVRVREQKNTILHVKLIGDRFPVRISGMGTDPKTQGNTVLHLSWFRLSGPISTAQSRSKIANQLTCKVEKIWRQKLK